VIQFCSELYSFGHIFRSYSKNNAIDSASKHISHHITKDTGAATSHAQNIGSSFSAYTISAGKEKLTDMPAEELQYSFYSMTHHKSILALPLDDISEIAKQLDETDPNAATSIYNDSKLRKELELLTLG
jgi:hypothetical protein